MLTTQEIMNDIAAVLVARCLPETICQLMNDLLCCEDDDGLSDERAEIGQSLFNSMVSLRPDLAHNASTGGAEPPPYTGCATERLCVHGNAWGTQDCPQCDGFNRPRVR